ncbi:MAG TPA: FlgD immunoglobulin-like domain containing protein [Cyclobacteriaceae bacterium]|nr:FlgD immunoglobulin-like domain containing protein [Cyclobacteriaceae bacterium]
MKLIFTALVIGFVSTTTLYAQDAGFQWADELSGSGALTVNEIGTDPSGNVYLGGYFTGEIDFDPSSSQVLLNSVGNQDMFIAKYTSSGAYVWAKQLGTATQEQVKSLKIDDSGNIYVCGFFYGTVDFDPNAGTFNMTSNGSSDGFLAKYNSSGTFIWAEKIGGTSPDGADKLDIDVNGGVYVVGGFQGTVDFDPGAGVNNKTSAGGYDAFLVKFNASGNYLYGLSLGGTGADVVSDIALDCCGGYLYITGYFQNTVDFNLGSGVSNLTSSGGYDGFLAKYLASNGGFSFAYNFGSTLDDKGVTLDLSFNGSTYDIYLAGSFKNTIDINLLAGTTNVTSNGAEDTFLAKYNDTCSLMWGGSFGAANSDIPSDIWTSGSVVVLTGFFRGTIDIDIGAGTTNLSSVPLVNSNALVAYFTNLGSLKWARGVGISGNSITFDTDPSGAEAIYVAGQFLMNTDFDVGEGTFNLPGTGSFEGFIAKYIDAAIEPSQTSSISTSNLTSNSVSINYTGGSGSGRLLVAHQGSSVNANPIDGIVYTASSVFGSGTQIGSGNYTILSGTGTVNLTGLTANTTYYLRAFEYDGNLWKRNYNTALASGNPLSFATLYSEPTIQANNITFTSAGADFLTLNWLNGNGTERLVLVRQGLPVNVNPSDGTMYSGNSNFLSATDIGSGNRVVYRGSGNSVNVTNLIDNTIYHVRVYELNGNSSQTNYLNTTATGNPGSRSTLTNEPTVQSSVLIFSNITESSVQLNFTNGNGTSRLVVSRLGSTVNTAPSDGSSYTANNVFGSAGSELGVGNFIVGSGTGPFTITGLASNATYYFKVFESNGNSGTENYLVTNSTGNPSSVETLFNSPTVQANNLSFNSIETNSIGISWNNGDGSERVLIARELNPVNVDPKDGQSYTGNSDFSIANDIGGGNKIVYRGAGNSVNITGLNANTIYHFRVYEIEGVGSQSNYLSLTALKNPSSIPTLVDEPIAQVSNLNFSLVESTSLQLNFDLAPGSPDGYLILRKINGPPTGIPADATSYSVNDMIGDGEVVQISNTTQFNDTNLTSGATYHYVVFSFNGFGFSTNYLTSIAGNTGAQLLLPPAPIIEDADPIGVNSFTARWQSTISASGYEVSVSGFSDFNTQLTGYPKTLGNVIDELVSGLNANSPYFVRVRAINATGLSAYSSTKPVQTLPTAGAPLSFATTPSYALEGTSIKLKISVSGGSGIKTVKLYYRKIMDNPFLDESISSTSEDTFEKILPNSILDKLGIEYYFTAIDGSISTPIETSHGFVYQTSAANELKVPNLSFGGKRENYRIISIPNKLEDNLVQSIFGVLGDYDKTKWRLVRYQNNNNEDFPAFNRIEQGKGYWFNSIENVEIKLGAGTSPENNQGKPFVLALAAGWNQIGNPYPFDVSWNDVLALNGNPTTVSGLYTYNPSNISFNKDVVILKAWEGGFVRADQAVNLTIPVTVKQTGGRQGRRNEIAGKKLDDSSWFVPITVTQGVAINQLGGFGMHPEASRSKDKFDEHSLPRFLNYLELNAYHNEYFMPKFTGDVVPTSENYTWDFVIESNFEGPTTQIQWDNLSLGVNDAQLLLVDVVENIIVDMKMNSYYVFSSSAKREFKVLFAIDEKHLQPQYTTVGKPYPNPFTSLVTLPILSAGNGHLQVAVYDMMGKQVKLLLNDVLPQGLHEVTWDGLDEQGSKVAGGVYIYNMRVTGGAPQNGRLVVK